MMMLHAVSVLVVFSLTMGSIRHINAASKASKVVGLSLTWLDVNDSLYSVEG